MINLYLEKNGPSGSRNSMCSLEPEIKSNEFQERRKDLSHLENLPEN